MSGISAWLLGVAGVILMSVLAELVLPEGQMNKYIKVIFSFVIILVIITPLPSLFGKEFNFNKFFGAGESELQENYLYQLNIDKVTAIKNDISSQLKDEGILNVEISINANCLSETLEIYGVYVDLCDIEYGENFASKDISKAKIVIRDIIDKTIEDVEVKFIE